MALVCLLLGPGLLRPEAAFAAALEHPFLGSFGVASQPTFTEAEGLAVDQSTGDLLVIDAGHRHAGEGTLSRWHPDGTPAPFSSLGTNVIGGLRFNFPEEVQVAVDNSGGPTEGDIYVTQVEPASIRIYAPDGSSLGQLTNSSEGPLHEPCGVGVDSTGNVFVGDFSGHIHKYGDPPVNGTTTDFGFAENCTLAAGAGTTAGALFAAHLHGSLAKLDGATGLEDFALDPGPTVTVSVNPANGHVLATVLSEVKEFDAGGSSAPTLLSTIAPGGEGVAGVAVNANTGDVYISRKGSPTIEVWGPLAQFAEATTEPASVVGGVATLHGTVSADQGPPATCVFEYVQINAKGFEGASTVPCTPSGPFTGTSKVAVSATIGGLAEGAYRFRLVAINEAGAKAGTTFTFDTFRPIPGLPDGRGYEMISPTHKTGEVIPPTPGGSDLNGGCEECLPGINVAPMPMQSAADGASVLYEGQPFSAGLASGPNEYISARETSGWNWRSISTPAITGRWEAFAADLSRGILQQTEPPLSPEVPTRGGRSFQELYLMSDEGLRPLVTQEPPTRESGSGSSQFHVSYSSANSGTATTGAFAHIIFEANDRLTGAVPGIAPEAPAISSGACVGEGAQGNCDLYEWDAGRLRLVSVLPGNLSAAQHSVFGSGRLLGGPHPETESANVSNAISADGETIFWTSEETGHVYARIGGLETLEVPGPATCTGAVAESARACFLTASSDGTQVLLSDGQIDKLNATGTAYQPVADVTTSQGGFQGILGAADDLSRVYFVDTAALTEAGETNTNGDHAVAGEANLYLWQPDGSRFIGTLLASDDDFGTNGRFGVWRAAASNRAAQVTADGSHLAFMSRASLTGYDNAVRGGGNCSGGSGPACFEVFDYSAATGGLVCASCNPTGGQPLGRSSLSLLVPAGGEGRPSYSQPGNLSRSGGGRLFFESGDALLPQDTNGAVIDIYEWEPYGIGSCAKVQGCLFLITSGNGATDSKFLDSTPSGNDAFFVTRQQLVPRDGDQQLDLYDARVGGGFEERAATKCGTEGCRESVPPSPSQPSAGSSSFSGPGNPKLPVKKKNSHRKQQKKKKKKHHRRGAHRNATHRHGQGGRK